MSLDASRLEPRPERLTADEARQRLEHARDTRITQIEALGQNSGALSVDDQLMSAQRDAIQRVLKEIEEAFARVEDGTYGTCLGCGKPVPGERLEILPYTRYCVGCQRRAT